MDDTRRHSHIRSYVLRQGRITTAQARAIEALGPRYLLQFRAAPVDFDAAFGHRAPRALEIGFGSGENLATEALAHPERDFIGVEVHAPGVGALLKRLDDLVLDNVRVVQHDAVEVVREMIAPASLASIQILFPDPWPKLRHHKRRLVQPAFAALLASRLAPGGLLHLATDWEDYAKQMLLVLTSTPGLVNTAEGFAPRPANRLATRFERRGERLGHAVWDLLFVRDETP